MNSKDIITVLDKVAADINITEAMFDSAEAEYKKMGAWIDKNTPDYDIDIYPQGSFALGTVVRPLDKEDEYDIDLVCEFAKDYGFTAQMLKSKVQSILTQYKRCESIEEKRRCWQVIYADARHFHMDVIPAISRSRYINITNKNDYGIYEYMGSNPKGYIEWFKNKERTVYLLIKESLRQSQHGSIYEAKIEPVKEYKIKTPLQKAVQILKRHRDVMFKDDENNCKPISIIISTMAAQLYNSETNVLEALTTIINASDDFYKGIITTYGYYLENPTYTGAKKENFADKWNVHKERAVAYRDWLLKLKADFDLVKLNKMTWPEFGKHITKILGQSTGARVFDAIAEEMRGAIKDQTMKVDKTAATISKEGTKTIPPTHHHGKVL